MNRRRLLKTALGAAAATAVGAPTLWLPRRAKGSWGEAPASTSREAVVGSSKSAKKVLELFLYGGVAAWETFSVNPTYGRPNDPDYPNQQWWTFQNSMPSVFETTEACGLGLTGATVLKPFGVDQLGMDIFFGPATWPLRERPDILARTRVVVNLHTFEPHEAAIPKVLTGRALGNPKLSGTGAAMAHFHNQFSLDDVPAPASYVFLAPIFGNDGVESASAVGALPASSRPLTVKLQSTAQATNALERANIAGHQKQFDDLLGFYRQRHDAMYTRPGTSEPMRSPGLDDYRYATGLLAQNDKLKGILTPELFQMSSGQLCGDYSANNLPANGIRIATELLQRETDGARYACVVDTGLIQAVGGGGYDTHQNHIHDSTRNMLNSFGALADNIRQPGEDAPEKLDLDETMIVLTTEFGRAPVSEQVTGRAHWPYGMVSVLIGGAIGPEEQGYVGALGPDGYATSYVTMEEFRAAVLLGAGIWPFEAETWAVGDIRGAGTEEEAALWLKNVVLGQGV